MGEYFNNYKCIGILGGTFNPVHDGHVMLAEAAKSQYLDIENIIVMPNNSPGYKDNKDIIISEHRLNMLKLAFDKHNYVHISDMEINRGGITYTFDTLTEIKDNNSKIKIYFIIGADSMYTFEKWFRYQDVLKMCTLLVATRECEGEELRNYVDEFLDKYPFASIEFLQTDNIDISSSELRDNILNPKYSCYVSDNVMEYIKENNLYGWTK